MKIVKHIAVNTLYQYTLDWSQGSKRHHLDGERKFIERYVGLDEFDSLFGGKMLLTDASGASEFRWCLGASGDKPYHKGFEGARRSVRHSDADANDRAVKIYTRPDFVH